MTSIPTRRPGELVFAIALLAFSLVALWQAHDISGFSSLTSAGVFPMLASGAMILAALFNLVACLAKPRADGGRAKAFPRFFHEVLPLRHVALLGLILLYLMAMPWLGFIASSGLFLFAAFFLLWRKGPVPTALLAAFSLGAIYVVFRLVFQVVLPQGSLLRGLF
ncbi:tripartite tricarboxylate transporter TctB family protein [Nisaea sediminum]|uniref:tripartite tricarboxylate transporter TctB family protein n=1 Tax=Nisaea sediminum TaxID=2775867 RepID=UPI001867E571|nr:tripartite tricarboxylate transporter TctB family protein [Nisaea sediminum]